MHKVAATSFLILMTLSFPLRAEVPPDFQNALSSFVAIREGLSADGAKIEPLFDQAMRITEQSSRVFRKDESDSVSNLEALSESEYASVKAQIPEMRFNREEFVAAAVDVQAFAALAHRFGDAADAAFFKVYSRTFDETPFLPNYLSQVTDYSACSTYGSGALSHAYLGWSGFIDRFPNRYQTFARTTAANLTKRLSSTDGDCVCEDARAVEKELDIFLRQSQPSALTRAVQGRLQRMASGRSKDSYHCLPN